MVPYMQAYRNLLKSRLQASSRHMRRMAFGSLSLVAVLSCATGCHSEPPKDAPPYVPPDLGSDPSNPQDPLYEWWAISAVSSKLVYEYTFAGQPSPPPDRNYKMDPHYVADGLDRYLFMAGSPAATAEQWSISFFRTALADMNAPEPEFDVSIPWQVAIKANAGTWFTQDALGPFGQISAKKGRIWFAGNGAANLPDYVRQIGRADFDATDTSKPPVIDIQQNPALTVPAFNGTQADSVPVEARPDAYGMSDPWIITDPANSNQLLMYYAGLNCAGDSCRFQILRATSTDDGFSFTPGQVVLSGRPGVAAEAGGVAAPSVVFINGQYAMAYSVLSGVPTKSRYGIRQALIVGVTTGMAVSRDGINWTAGTPQGMPLLNYTKGVWGDAGVGSPSLYLQKGVVQAFLGGALIDSVGGQIYYYENLGTTASMGYYF